MGSDFFLVFRWWGTLFLVGAFAYPVTKRLFSAWHDSGYMLAKAVGMAVVTYLVYLFGIIHLLPFTVVSVYVSLGVLFVIGLVVNLMSNRKPATNKMLAKGILIIGEEVFFFAALLFWSWVKGHEASIHGLEKFMDFGFTKSILDSAYFPAPDMWYAGLSINYYYFGHTVMAVLTRLSGIDLVYTFNLMLSTIFALTLTMSFSIGYQLISGIKGIKKIGIIGGAILTAFLVTLAGNMQTLYAFTRGYTGDNVQPFWTLFWPIGEFWKKLPEGLDRYWYANATRFIPFTIHEFPSYSFVVSDVHGHVLSLPFVLLAIALLIHMFGIRPVKTSDAVKTERKSRRVHQATPLLTLSRVFTYGFYGLLVAILLMTNALDGPIYLGLFIVILGVVVYQSGETAAVKWKTFGLSAGIGGVTAAVFSIPFMAHFSSFVSGLAINCPPAFLANHKIGIFLFEGVEKCQHSPLWMMALLWGFFVYCGIWLLVRVYKQSNMKVTHTESLLTVFFILSLGLIIFPEFFYFKDIYPMHFRSNTMFKLGYQAFIMFSVISGYTIVKMLMRTTALLSRRIFILFLIPMLFFVSIYPIFSVRSYFDSLRSYKGLDGLAWLRDQYPDDYDAIRWLNARFEKEGGKTPVIVEADGESYTDYARISAFTGFPTIVGWPVHEWLWRGSYDVVAPRRSEVQTIYDSEYLENTKIIIAKYGIRYIIVGTPEWQKYPKLSVYKFTKLGKLVYTKGQTSIFEVSPFSN